MNLKLLSLSSLSKAKEPETDFILISSACDLTLTLPEIVCAVKSLSVELVYSIAPDTEFSNTSSGLFESEPNIEPDTLFISISFADNSYAGINPDTLSIFMLSKLRGTVINALFLVFIVYSLLKI